MSINPWRIGAEREIEPTPKKIKRLGKFFGKCKKVGKVVAISAGVVLLGGAGLFCLKRAIKVAEEEERMREEKREAAAEMPVGAPGVLIYSSDSKGVDVKITDVVKYDNCFVEASAQPDDRGYVKGANLDPYNREINRGIVSQVKADPNRPELAYSPDIHEKHIFLHGNKGGSEAVKADLLRLFISPPIESVTIRPTLANFDGRYNPCKVKVAYSKSVSK